MNNHHISNDQYFIAHGLPDEDTYLIPNDNEKCTVGCFSHVQQHKHFHIRRSQQTPSILLRDILLCIRSSTKSCIGSYVGYCIGHCTKTRLPTKVDNESTSSDAYEVENDDNKEMRGYRESSQNKKKSRRSIWSAVLFGQTIAFALASGNAASSTLENDFRVRIPTFQTGFVYLLLSFHLIFLFARHRRDHIHSFQGNFIDLSTHIEKLEDISSDYKATDRHSSNFKQMTSNRNILPQNAPVITNAEVISPPKLLLMSSKNQSNYTDELLPFHPQQQVSTNSTINMSGRYSHVTINKKINNILVMNKLVHTFPFTNLPLQTHWMTYLLLAILDVEANYLAMLSFQHTSLSSSMLLTSLSVVSTMILRYWVFLCFGGGSNCADGGDGFYKEYGLGKLVGAIMCICGGCLWIWVDNSREESNIHAYGLANNTVDDDDLATTPPKDRVIHNMMDSRMIGDLLALACAFLYGVNDLLAEYTLKSNNDRYEFLGMMGLFGSIFSFFIQVPLVEMENVVDFISAIRTEAETDVGPDRMNTEGAAERIIWFLFTMCYFYIAVSIFLSANDATLLNLSLQSCPLWAVILTIWGENLQRNNVDAKIGRTPPSMFFVSLAMVVTGMFLYESYFKWDESSQGNENSESGYDFDDENSNKKCVLCSDAEALIEECPDKGANEELADRANR